MSSISIDYCGEWFYPKPDEPFEIGREAELSVDDNPYLHRRLLRVSNQDDIWWLANVGSHISVTVCDASGGVQSWLSPGNRLPIVFPVTTIVFTAGPTTYELLFHLAGSPYQEVVSDSPLDGETTIGVIPFTLSQKQLIVALCEPMLKRDGAGFSEIPSTAEAAKRLGWTTTRFNRKLDNVCDKLDKLGVKGLRGGPRQLATNRRARLVEYAVTSRLVVSEDLPLLDIESDE